MPFSGESPFRTRQMAVSMPVRVKKTLSKQSAKARF